MKKFIFIENLIESCISLYIFLMFLTKGETIRISLIITIFILWLFIIKHRNYTYIMKEPLTVFLSFFIVSVVLSAGFSIDPAYSLNSLKGEPLKFILLFPIISTILSDEEKMKRLIHVIFFSMIFIISAGYYSYLMYDTPLLCLKTSLIRGWHNKFALYLNTFLPFAFILYFLWEKMWLKIILILVLMISVFSLILSTSRGGLLAFLCMVIIWIFYFAKIKKHNMKKVICITIMVLFSVGIISWITVPYFRERMTTILDDLPTFHLRSKAWVPAIEAFKQRPLFGWGYGKHIFYQSEPYKKTSYKNPPPFKPHNTFIKILFHQGIIGLLTYILMIFMSIFIFLKEVKKSFGLKSHILVACISILLGNYIVHSMFEDLHLQHLAVILGLGVAAKAMNNGNRVS